LTEIKILSTLNTIPKKGAVFLLRIFAISDIHIDYKVNKKWIDDLSRQDYINDILIIAGDITSDIKLLEYVFKELKRCFSEVLYVPGNHDLWVLDDPKLTSIGKFYKIIEIAENNGVITKPYTYKNLSIVPIFGWYDYSFQKKTPNISKVWMDYSACRWPDNFNESDVCDFFTEFNINNGNMMVKNDLIISYSHFLPRIDIMPFFIPPKYREIYCVLGSSIIESQIRNLKSNIHVYGHSHVNLRDFRDSTLYINNAYGYPYETRICAKKLTMIHEL